MSWRRRVAIAAAVIVVAIGVFAAANFQGLMLAIAISRSEQRPALLSDIREWDKPEGATAFRARFHAGVPEAELLAWLRENRFLIDRRARHAEYRIKGLPCNELARVIWSANGGTLRDAQATLSEAGCL